MDYSLLVGIDDENKELVLGIIDFMTIYLGQTLGDMGKGLRHTWWTKECSSDNYFSEAVQEKIQKSNDNLLSNST